MVISIKRARWSFPIYYNAYDFSDGAALVEIASGTDQYSYTYIDKRGERIFDKEFSSASSYSEGYAVVLKSGYAYPVPPEIDVPQKWSYIDKNGNFATENEYDNARGFNNGYAAVEIGGKWGVIGAAFNTVVECIYEDIGTYEDGLMVSCKIKRPKKETHRENSGIMLSDENKNRRYQYESSK